MDGDAIRYGLTINNIEALKTKATAAKSYAHCPYSNFRVGAAILSGDTIYTGVNVENASYPVGICAEKCAISKAVSEGVKQFRALAVATDISPPASPCGMCRQFIREFCKLDIPIFMFDKNGDYVVKTLEELLPMSFAPKDLRPSN